MCRGAPRERGRDGRPAKGPRRASSGGPPTRRLRPRQVGFGCRSCRAAPASGSSHVPMQAPSGRLRTSWRRRSGTVGRTSATTSAPSSSCRASPPMKQKRQRRLSQKPWKSAATRISSFTTRGHLHEPALLLDEAGRRAGRPRGDRVVRLAAKKGDRPLRVEPAQLLAPHPFQPRPGLLPRLHPAPREGEVIGVPICRWFLCHPPSIGSGFGIGDSSGPGAGLHALCGKVLFERLDHHRVQAPVLDAGKCAGPPVSRWGEANDEFPENGFSGSSPSFLQPSR